MYFGFINFINCGNKLLYYFAVLQNKKSGMIMVVKVCPSSLRSSDKIIVKGV